MRSAIFRANKGLITGLSSVIIGSSLLFGCNSSDSLALRPMSSVWEFKQSLSSHSSEVTCVVESTPTRYSTGVGVDEVRVVIADNGRVSLRTEHDPFDRRALNQIGILVDGKTSFLAPQMAGPRRLEFSTAQSAALLDRMSDGRSARVQVAIYPREELLSTVLPLDGFDKILLDYRMCEIVRAERQAAYRP